MDSSPFIHREITVTVLGPFGPEYKEVTEFEKVTVVREVVLFIRDMDVSV